MSARRTTRVGLAAVVAGLLLADLAAFRAVANHAQPVSLSNVIARYRKAAAATTGLATVSGAATMAPVAPPLAAAVDAAAGAPAAKTGPAATPVAVAPTGARPLAAPAPGVYRYQTAGHEDTDAVGGASHTYPDETTITVTPSPCGFTMRWDALQQRWDQWTVCASGRQLLVSGEAMKHAFYGVNDERSYGCERATFRPGPETANAPVAGHCAGSGDDAVWSGKVVGIETVTVAGSTLAALHVQIQEHMTGNTTGIRRSDNWFALDSGLLLRRVASVVGDSSTPVGKAHYTENVTLDLISVAPTQ